MSRKTPLPEPVSHPRDRLKRELSLNDASMLVVASVIGSGIFLTPGRVAELLPNAGVLLFAWFAGGLLSLAGALANAEMGAMYPHAGGDYVYLSKAFHPAAGFLIGWFTFFAIFAGTVATLAVALAESITSLFSLNNSYGVLIAFLFVLVTSAINYIGVRWGARFNNVTSFIKIAVLVLFCVLGPLWGNGNVEYFLPDLKELGPVSLTAFTLALSPILFTYLGWNSPVYVAGEIRNADRNLPRSLFLGLAICTAIYLLMNLVYLYAVPPNYLRGEINVGEAAALALFGPVAGSYVAMFVLISILGTLNATVLVGPRIVYAMALDGLFFKGADRVHQRYSTPHRAIVVQAAVAAALIAILQDFSSILDFTVFGIVVASMADILALYALRIRFPFLPRPYRAWGYPLVPALYLLANTGIVWVMVQERPKECAVGALFLVAGIPFYRYFVGRNARNVA